MCVVVIHILCQGTRPQFSGLLPRRHQRHGRQHLADALYQQAFASLTASPGARAYYDKHRDRGATHHQALRALGNRLVSILHGCLRHHTPYDETTAWAGQTAVDQVAA